VFFVIDWVNRRVIYTSEVYENCTEFVDRNFSDKRYVVIATNEW